MYYRSMHGCLDGVRGIITDIEYWIRINDLMTGAQDHTYLDQYPQGKSRWDTSKK